MPKIHLLPPLTDSADGDDVLAMDDASVADPTSPAKTKKISLTQIKTWLQSLSKWVTTSMLADDSVTNDKIPDGTVLVDAAVLAVVGANYTLSFCRAMRFGSIVVVHFYGTSNSTWGDSNVNIATLNLAALGCTIDPSMPDQQFVLYGDGGNNVVGAAISPAGVIYSTDSTLGRGAGVVSGNGCGGSFAIIVKPV